MQKTLFIILLGLMMSLPTITKAQMAETTGDDNELDAIVVSANRITETLRETTRQMTIVTEEELRESNATDFTEILEKHGIQINREGSDLYGNAGISMRGGISSMHGLDLGGDILILVDGRRSATDFASGFDLGNIRRIEVIHGPGAVQYGSAAIGGVINILTKRGTDTPEGRLEVGIGSWSEGRTKLSGSGKIGKFDLAASASFLTRDSYQKPNGDVMNNTDLNSRKTYSVNIGYNINADNRIGVLLHGSDTSGAGKGSNEGTATYSLTRQNRKDWTVDLLYEGSKDNMGWLVRYFQGTTKFDLSRYYPGYNRSRLVFSTTKDKFKGAQAQFNMEIGKFSFVTGVDWIKYDIAQNQIYTVPTSSKGTITNTSFFAIGKYKILPAYNFELSGGLRYDKFDVKVNGITRLNYNLKVNTSFDNLSPTVGVTFSPIEFIKFRANYGFGFKSPLPRQFGGFTYMGTVPYAGNPQLKPEESENIEFGFDAEYKGLFISATYFSSKYKNLIASMSIVPSNPLHNPNINAGNYYMWGNIEKATVRGMELGGSFDFGKHFGLSFDLETYVHWTRLFRFTNDVENEKLNDRSRDTLSFGADFAYKPAQLIIGLNGVRHGKMITGSSTAEGPVEPATVFDFNIKKGLYTFGDYGTASIKVNVKNIFNEDYQRTRTTVNLMDTMPGRSFYVALEYSY
jgi:vitamin B12 transporter